MKAEIKNDWSIIDRFCRRLKSIGIEVELHGNLPWIYLYSVNGKRVTVKFQAKHGFCAFYSPIRDLPARFSDRKEVFKMIRVMIS